MCGFSVRVCYMSVYHNLLHLTGIQYSQLCMFSSSLGGKGFSLLRNVQTGFAAHTHHPIQQEPGFFRWGKAAGA